MLFLSFLVPNPRTLWSVPGKQGSGVRGPRRDLQGAFGLELAGGLGQGEGGLWGSSSFLDSVSPMSPGWLL